MKKFTLASILVLLMALLSPLYVNAAGLFGVTPWKRDVEDKALIKEPGKHIFENISSSRTPNNNKNYRDGQILVKFKNAVTATEQKKKNIHRKHGSEKIKELKSHGIHHVKLRKGWSVEEAVKEYKAEPDVEYAEPNYLLKPLAIPNDAFFNQLWGLYNTGQTGGTAGVDIKAPAAWDVSTGSNDIVVAVIDTGVDYTHPDLDANIWVNPSEVQGNSVDDDTNGYTDDIHGIDTYNHDTDPTDDVGHGTHVAGIIGASGNNGIGVSGVNWNTKILSCKFLGPDGGDVSGAIECLEYIKALKNRPVNPVNIVATNNSWGMTCGWGDCFPQSLYNAIKAQPDILFIAAAGNDGRDNNTFYAYPANFNLPNVITVAATDHNDRLASFSDYGSQSVHVGAPGVDILSTVPGGYDVYSGTSMATPYVTGLAALLKSQNPTFDAQKLKNLILSGGDAIPSLAGTTISGKRINAFNSLTCDNQMLFKPLQYPAAPAAGVPVTLTVLSLNCALPAGVVTVTTSAGTVITLHDDGTGGDAAANDGIFTGTWTPSGNAEKLSFSSPAGSAVLVIPKLNLVTTTSALSQGFLNTPFSQTLTASGGLSPYTWDIIDGALPPGLTLNSTTGEITGVPTAAGEFGFTVKLIEGFQTSLTMQLSIIIRSVDYTPTWTRTLNPDTDSFDFANGVVADKSGNVYVTGYSDNKMLTVKYDPEGNMLWSRSFGSMGSAIALDPEGNVYVTGNFNKEYMFFTEHDAFAIKYDPYGNVIWSNIYCSGNTQIDSYGYALTLDESGNLLVAGVTGIYGENYDYLLMKIDPSGHLVWRHSYNRGANDTAEGIAIDGSGNIYVTGSSNFDCLTLKFDSSANLLWSKTYSAGAYTYGNAVAADGNGNVYITGAFHNNDFERFFILKYDPEGNVLWNKIRDKNNYGERYGKQVAVDSSNNVYAVGELVNGAGYYDLFFIIYDPSGNVTGYQKYSGTYRQSGYGIAVDDTADNVYVTGYSLNDPDNWFQFDYLTMRYEKSVLHVSSAQVLPSGKLNTPYSQVLSARGSQSPSTWAVEPGTLPPGLELNTSTGEISGVPSTLGKFDFTVQVADTSNHTATKLITLAVMDITTTSLPPANVDVAYSQIVQGEGGVPPYSWSIATDTLPAGLSLDRTTGRISGVPAAGPRADFTVRIHDSAGNSITQPLSITVVCPPPVITTTTLPSGFASVFYNNTLSASGGRPPYTWSVSAGSLPSLTSLSSWTGTISGIPTTQGTYPVTIQVSDVCTNTVSKDFSIEIAVAPLSMATWGFITGQVGSVYLQTAEASGGLPPYSWSLTSGTLPNGLAFDPANGTISGIPSGNGTFTFTLQVKDSTTTMYSRSFTIVVAPQPVADLTSIIHPGEDNANSITLDAAGNIYVIGSFFNTPRFDMMTIKYDPAGNVLWQRLLDSGYNEYGKKVAVDSNNNVYVTGDGNYCYLTAKYDQSGNLLWTKKYAPPLSGYVSPTGIGTDSAGNVYVTGSYSNNPAGRSEFLTIKYDPLGNMLWSKTAFASGQNYYSPELVIDRSDNVYVSGLGQSTGGTTVNSAITIKYDSAGTELWSQSVLFRPSGMAIDGSDNIYVAGFNTMVKYDSAGTLMWNKNYDLPIGKIASDSAGNIHALESVTYSSKTSFSVLRCDTAGNVIETLLFNIGASVSTGGITIAPGGYPAYITGTIRNGSDRNSDDFFIVKYGDGVKIATQALPAAHVQGTYNLAIQASGGTSPYLWSVLSGTLPGGLTLDVTTGVITGIPAQTGTSICTLQVVDAAGGRNAKAFSIVVSGALPEISFTGTPLTGQAPLSVAFSQSIANNPASWSWAFGDGSMTSTQNPSHMYMTPGVYSVTLTATNGEGANSLTKTDYINVLACQNQPVWLGTSPQPAFATIQAAYDAAVAEDIIYAQAVPFSGDLLMSRDITVTLKGGYDCGFTTNPMASTISGTLRVLNGTVKPQGLWFR